MKKLIHRVLRVLRLRVERHRDPYRDMAEIVGENVKCCIDGGAYKGAATREFMGYFREAMVHAFEANPQLASALEASPHTAGSPRLEIHTAALSDVTGHIDFYVPAKDFTGSTLKPGAEFGEARKISVPAITLDDFGQKPDVIKLDLQGAELKALEGAQTILPTVKAVLCEVNFVPRYEGCAEFHQIADLLSIYGLRLFRLYEVHSAKSGQWQFADALFVRS